MAEATVETPPVADAAPPEDPGAQVATAGNYDPMDWRSLPDLSELRADPKVANVIDVYPDMKHFVRDAVEWRQEVGRRVRLPSGENVTPEDMQRFWQQVPGYPKSPQGYGDAVQLPSLGQDAEGQDLAWDPNQLTTFWDTAHSIGLTAPQAQAVLEQYARNLSESRNILDAQQAQTVEETQRELQKRFGASLNRRVAAARNYFMRTLGNTELGDRIWHNAMEQGWGNDPDVIEFFSMQYDRFGEPADLLSDNLFPVTPTMSEMTEEKQKVLSVVNDPKKTPAERELAWTRLNRLNDQLGRMSGATRR
jgi:hypothetical protein